MYVGFFPIYIQTCSQIFLNKKSTKPFVREASIFYHSFIRTYGISSSQNAL